MESDIHKGQCQEPLLQSGLAITAAACWNVLKFRRFIYFPQVLEFLECVYRTAPDLLHYRHFAKLALGLRATVCTALNLIILDVIARDGTNKETWRMFQQLFSNSPLEAAPHVTHRALQKVQSADLSFRKMVKRLFEDKEFCKSYMNEQVALDYGEPFVAMLQNLMREFLVRLNSALSENKSQKLLSALESDCICPDSVSP
ncbi:TERF1-interacting nuclear factor 2 isoform X1 [Pelobates fuscus]|uniref:TERF1-interacting nuclear factor 2 isoform X1 n=1 Tax=Pelobates fuscus TaxID=191477 RepID=UPI002FE4BB35